MANQRKPYAVIYYTESVWKVQNAVHKETVRRMRVMHPNAATGLVQEIKNNKRVSDVVLVWYGEQVPKRYQEIAIN